MDQYEEQLDDTFNRMNQIRGIGQQPFESEFATSKHLLDISQYTSSGVNHDSARANLNFNELRQARCDGYLIQELEEAEKTCGWDLQIQKDKTMGKLGVLNVTSRAKQGWASVLSKTDKHINIQTAEQYANEINDEFTEQTEMGMMDKIRSKVPFLKKKEL
jgi:hypothetical protein